MVVQRETTLPNQLLKKRSIGSNEAKEYSGEDMDSGMALLCNSESSVAVLLEKQKEIQRKNQEELEK